MRRGAGACGADFAPGSESPAERKALAVGSNTRQPAENPRGPEAAACDRTSARDANFGPAAPVRGSIALDVESWSSKMRQPDVVQQDFVDLARPAGAASDAA